MNEAFLAFLVDRFDLAPITLVISNPDGSQVQVDLAQVGGRKGVLVTHDPALLIAVLRKYKLELPETLVDIVEALKLSSQISKDQGGERHWDVWMRAAKYMQEASSAKRFGGLLDAREAPPPIEDVIRLTMQAAAALRALWIEVNSELIANDEITRFEQIEIPVQQIFHRREYAGIGLQSGVLSSFIKACENEKYSLFRKIAIELGRSPLGIRDGRLTELMVDRGMADHPSDGFALERWLDLAAIRSQQASVLLDYIRSKRDLNILQETNAIGGRVYPRFQVHGTVTSRILASEPRLQQLRKRFRSIVAPDDGFDLLYLDYAQFEPAIVAHLSQDVELQSAYRSGDLYLALADAMSEGEGASGRGVAKRIFLAFLYGMTRTGISALLGGTDPHAGRAQEQEVAQFFSRFHRVEEFRMQAQADLRQGSVVRTPLGNGRRRITQGRLTLKEERWAMNHKVQGTASLIFKKALLLINKKFGWNAVLLPMHDAVLLQFPTSTTTREDFSNECAAAMQEAFRQICSSFEVRVSEATF